MTTPRKVSSIFSMVVFCLGLVIGMALAGWYVWGEAEAVLFVARSGDVTLTTLKCPLILGGTETGTVSASFSNPTSDTIHPTITAEISHGRIPREESAVIDLEPGQAKQVQWQVGAADKTFGALILVNVLQSSQADYASGQGSCGILLVPVGNVPGKDVFIFMFAAALMAIAGGLIWWRRVHPRLRGLLENATNALTTLGAAVGLALVFILPHWWVVSGILFMGSIMLIGIILTEFILFPGGVGSARR